MIKNIIAFAIAIFFGFVLSRSGATDYDTIQHMFLLDSFQLYGIIGVAILLTAPGLYLLKKRGRTIDGGVLTVKPKARHRGNAVGGALFGIGWAITGMCPGPVMVNIGEGKLYALGALAGVVMGVWILGTVYPKLRAPLKLPQIRDAGQC